MLQAGHWFEPSWKSQTDRVIDTIYQLLYRFFLCSKPLVLSHSFNNRGCFLPSIYAFTINIELLIVSKYAIVSIKTGEGAYVVLGARTMQMGKKTQIHCFLHLNVV